jgi:hypothetical protein
MRAALLPRHRRRTPELDPGATAAALRNLVEAGTEPPVRSEAVLVARDDLLEIARLLGSARQTPAALLECAEWLTWSQNSPVCSEPAPDADVAQIAARLRAALAAREAQPDVGNSAAGARSL